MGSPIEIFFNLLVLICGHIDIPLITDWPFLDISGRYWQLDEKVGGDAGGPVTAPKIRTARSGRPQVQETSVEEAMNAATRVEATVDLDNFWIYYFLLLIYTYIT